MKYLVVYKELPDKVDYREVIECDEFGMAPSGKFVFIQIKDLPPYRDSHGISWTPIEGVLQFSIPFESVQRIEAI